MAQGAAQGGAGCSAGWRGVQHRVARGAASNEIASKVAMESIIKLLMHPHLLNLRGMGRGNTKAAIESLSTKH